MGLVCLWSRRMQNLFTDNDIIDPNRVISCLSEKLNRTEYLSTEDLIKIVRMILPRKSGIKITFQRARSAKDCFMVNGYFDSEVPKDIELQICCSSYKKRFPLTPGLKKFIIEDIADTLCHESIHRKQFKLRGKESSTTDTGIAERDYYLDPDEMFAFSVNIAHNLHRKFGKTAVKKLSNVKRVIKVDSYLADYYFWFYNDQPFRRMLKLIFQNLQAIEKGRVCHRSLI